MRVLARISYTLAGLALALPASAVAGDQDQSTTPPPAKAPHKHRRTLFGGERLCAECQRAKAMAKDGVNVPPPPPLPGPTVSGGECATCGTQTQVLATHTPMTVAPSAPMTAAQPAMVAAAPGVAAVGGDAVGHAAVGDDPTPIGVYQPRVAARGPAAGLRDSAVAATSYAPPMVEPVPANRPHILSHLFGVSAIGRHHREAAERKAEEKHASIAYDAKTPVVNDLPAKAVYGR